ncbi:retrovirus-related Pol polyprotein from transposon TNT 1-94 [Trichonephila clavipes]|nr:retrovirus-related Pol polyprotein from transposon TNT 1-94 [Trichonephila clavipes]
MKQDLEKAENAYLSSFTSKKSKTLPGATAAAHGDPNGKNDYQKKGGKPDHYIIPKSKEISFFSDVTAKTKNGSIEIWHQRFCHVNNDYLVKTSKNDSVKVLPRLTDNGKTHCIPCKLAKSKRVSFKKTGAVRSKRPLELLHMDLCGPMPTESQGGNKYFLSIIDDYSRKGTVFPIRNKSDVFHTFIRFQKRAERFLSKRKDNTESQGFSDLSEQQEALMVEVTIPNCYKQAIRSRNASKRHDAMDKEINVMMERKVWDLVDHPDNIKILKTVGFIPLNMMKNNKIVRYKTRYYVCSKCIISIE